MQAKAKKTGDGVLVAGVDLGKRQTGEFKRIIADATTEELKAELSRLLGFSADNLTRLALITQELEARGEDLSAIRFGLLPLLRQIASGTLLPEIVVKFAGEPDAIRKIGRLSIDAQEDIASGKVDYTVYTLPPPKPPIKPVEPPRSVQTPFIPVGRPRVFQPPPHKWDDDDLMESDNSDPKNFSTEERLASLNEKMASTEAASNLRSLICLLKTGKIAKIQMLDDLLLELSKLISERNGQVLTSDVRMIVGAYLAERSVATSLIRIAKETKISATDLTKAMEGNLWFTNDGQAWCLTSAGRRQFG